MTEPVPVWPAVPVVHGMLRAGLAGVFRTPLGAVVAGLRSTHPWIYYATNVGAVCERCYIRETPPEPPRGTHGPLFGPTTVDYALYLLAWLHPFAGRHSICEPKREAAA